MNDRHDEYDQVYADPAPDAEFIASAEEQVPGDDPEVTDAGGLDDGGDTAGFVAGASRASVLDVLVPILQAQLGTTEHPLGSNKQKYGKAYGWDGVAWCVIFSWWIAQQVGMPASAFPKTAAVALLRDWAKSHGHWSTHPRVLDVGLYPYGVSHAVVVEKVLSGGQVQCIAGNTNAAGSRDADRVARKTYPISCFSGFFQPHWASATKVPGKPKPSDLRRPYPGRVLKRGSHGKAVEHIQTELNRRRKTAPILAVDGDFGPKTEKRVKGFQSNHKLARDGQVGPLTWGELFK